MYYPHATICIDQPERTLSNEITPAVIIHRFPDKSNTYLSSSIQVSCKGNLNIQNYGCIPLTPGDKMIFEGKCSERLFLSSKLSVFPENHPSMTASVSSFFNPIGQEQMDWKTEINMKIPVCWTLQSNGVEESTFLHMQDAIQSFSAARNKGWKVLFRKITRNHRESHYPVFSFLADGLLDEINIHETASRQELTFLQQYKASADFVIPNTEPMIRSKDIEEVLQYLHSLETEFHCFFSSELSDKGQYAFHCMPDRVCKSWYTIGRLKQIPALYKRIMLTDGSIFFTLPKQCDSWSEEQRTSEIKRFTDNVSLSLLFGEIRHISDLQEYVFV